MAPGAWLGQAVKEAANRVMPEFHAEVRTRMSDLNEEENERMIGRSVRENLVELNTTASIMQNHSYYNQMSVLVADPNKEATLRRDLATEDGVDYLMLGIDEQNIGAELVGKWYTRNIKIFSNILRSIAAEDERIVVMFGQGHIRPILHFCEDHPSLNIVEPNKYLNDNAQ